MAKKTKKNNKSLENANTTASKKSMVLGKEKKNNIIPVIAGIACLAIVVAVGVVYFSGNAEIITAKPVSTKEISETLVSQITYPVADFEDGQARHFEYADGPLTIRYFILKSSDGVIRAAFDACDVCWPAGKGYQQEGDLMICRNCGRRFPSVKINEVQGGCNPAPLTRTISGDQLVIRIDDILQGKQYFDFSGKA